MKDIIFNIIGLACFGWFWTVHTYIQLAVGKIPKYNILLPFIKLLSCTRCFTFNFSLFYLWITTGDLFLSFSQACVACVIASIIWKIFDLK